MTYIRKKKDPLFLRNAYQKSGKWGIPLVRKQVIDTSQVSLIACSETRPNDSERNRKKGVSFFVDDYRFTGIYNNPEKSLSKYKQYAFLLTPDFSTYADMDMWRQLESVAHNRWCGAYWQEQGLAVLPTISWSTVGSFEFCFDGVEEGSIVAIGMLGCKRRRRAFLTGFREMLARLQPETIICLGDPFDEMQGNLIVVPYDRLGGRNKQYGR